MCVTGSNSARPSAIISGSCLLRAKVGRLHANLIPLTAEVPDSFQSDPANRPDPSSPFYHFTYHFRDGGRWWRLFVVVDDSTAAYGVLRIVYADCQ